MVMTDAELHVVATAHLHVDNAAVVALAAGVLRLLDEKARNRKGKTRRQREWRRRKARREEARV